MNLSTQLPVEAEAGNNTTLDEARNAIVRLVFTWTYNTTELLSSTAATRCAVLYVIMSSKLYSDVGCACCCPA